MTVEDCYELAKIAYSEADYYHTELWMEQALKQLDGGEESTLDRVTVLDYLSYAIYQQGEIMRALEYTKKLLELGESSLNVSCIIRWLTGAKHNTTVFFVRCAANREIMQNPTNSKQENTCKQKKRCLKQCLQRCDLEGTLSRPACEFDSYHTCSCFCQLRHIQQLYYVWPLLANAVSGL